MRFPRHAKIFRGQLDAAPFAGVFFLILLFLLFNSSLVFTPGVKVELPVADDLPGVMNPTVVVMVDRGGQLYYENQAVDERELRARLHAATQARKDGSHDLTLVVQADRAVAYGVVVRLAELARASGIRQVLQATRPPHFQSATNTPTSR